MLKILFLAVFIGLPVIAAPTVVECSGKVGNKTETALFKIEDGLVIQWDAHRYAKGKQGSLFFWFVQKIEDSAAEGYNSYRSRNGYSIIEAVTTADTIKIGINLEMEKGFYDYNDNGSGNGNSRVSLICRRR